MKFIALFFPLITLAVVFKAFSVHYDEIFDARELELMSNPANGLKGKYDLLNKLKLIFGMLFFMVIYAGAQTTLFRLAEDNAHALFVDRMADHVFYALLPGVFFGIVICGFLIYKRESKKPREVFKAFLLQLEGGMTGYQGYKFLKGFSIALVVFALVANVAAYKNYLSIDGTQIKYSRLMSPISIKRPVDDLRYAVYYSQRKGPNGKIYHNIHPELVFADNVAVQTLNLVYGNNFHELNKALLTATHHKIQILKVKGYSKTPFQY